MAQLIDTRGFEGKDLKFEITGFADFEQQIIKLSEGLSMDVVLKNTLAKAAEQSMQSVFNAAKAYAPYDVENPRDEYSPFHMRDTLRLKSRLTTPNDRGSPSINDNSVVLALVTVKKSAVSLAQEYGTKKIPARPFLRPALQYGTTQVISDLRDSLAEIIPAYAQKLARKRK
jgi:HK97 gp10 family phage protein